MIIAAIGAVQLIGFVWFFQQSQVGLAIFMIMLPILFLLGLWFIQAMYKVFLDGVALFKEQKGDDSVEQSSLKDHDEPAVDRPFSKKMEEF